MAVIQYTALIAQIRGSLGGSTLSKSKNGFTISKKPAPRQLKSMAQRAVINGFASNAINWNSLSGTDRTNWATLASASPQYNRIGDLVNMTGYNFYILVSQLLQPTGPGPAIIADGNSTSPYTVSAELLTLEFQDFEGDLKVIDLELSIETLSTCVNDCTAVVYLSQPIENDTSQLPGDWYRIGSFLIVANETIGTVQTENFEDFPKPAGLNVVVGGLYFVQIRVVNNVTKNISPLAYSDSLVPNILPPVVIPTLFLLTALGFSDYLTFSTFIDYVDFDFRLDDPALDNSAYMVEFIFRGFNLSNDEFLPYMSVPIGLFDFTGSPSSEFAELRSDNNVDTALTDALNATGINWTPQLGDTWALFTFRLKNKTTHNYGPWSNGSIQQYDQ